MPLTHLDYDEKMKIISVKGLIKENE
jgi:hypothetical protein